MDEQPKRHTGGGRHQADRHHGRPADPAEEEGQPLVRKESQADELSEGTEPGKGTAGPSPDPPHHDLSNPVGEPDLTKDSDPYEEEDLEQDAPDKGGLTRTGAAETPEPEEPGHQGTHGGPGEGGQEAGGEEGAAGPPKDVEEDPAYNPDDPDLKRIKGG